MERIITPHATSYTFKDIWHYRELFYFLVWRDIKVRYKQTIIGVLWVIIQPFITMVVFSFIFGTVARIETGEIPYPIFVYTGLLFWNLFSQSVRSSSESLIANQNLVKKVYFPKLILPVASAIVNLIDFFFAAIMLVFLMLYFRYTPNFFGLLIVPLGLISILMFSIGIGSILASLNVIYRDIRFIVPYMLQILLFLTPVVYPSNILGEKYQVFLTFNPLTGIIDSIRSGIFGTRFVDFFLLGFSMLISFICFIIGIKYFIHREKYFADIV